MNRSVFVILVTGGRDFTDMAEFEKAADYVMSQFTQRDVRAFAFIQGGAKGADALCKRFCKARGLPCLTMEADWDFYGKRAGPLRNQWMLDIACPDFILAMPGRTGTQDMCTRAGLRKVPGIRVLQGANGYFSVTL